MPVRLDASAYPPMPRPTDSQQQPPGPPMPGLGTRQGEPGNPPMPAPRLGQKFTVQPDGSLYPAPDEGTNRYAPAPVAGPPMPSLQGGAPPVMISRGGGQPVPDNAPPAGAGMALPDVSTRQGRMSAHFLAPYMTAQLGQQQHEATLAAQGRQHEATLALEREKLTQEKELMAQRQALEYGPAKAANEIYNQTYVAGATTHGDLARASREAQQAKDAFLRQSGAFAPPAQPNTGGGQNQPVQPPEQQAPPDEFTDNAAKQALTGAGILNEKGVSPSQSLDSLALGKLLQENQALSTRGLPAVARVLGAANVPQDKVQQALERALIRFANEGVMGGSWHTGSVGGPLGAETPAPAEFGPYKVEPTYEGPAAESQKVFGMPPPRHRTGFVVRGPGGERWYPDSMAPGVGPGPEDFLPTIREQTKADYRARGEALSRLLQALHAGANAGQTGSPPMTGAGAPTGSAAPPPPMTVAPAAGIGAVPPTGVRPSWAPPVGAGGPPTGSPR